MPNLCRTQVKGAKTNLGGREHSQTCISIEACNPTADSVACGGDMAVMHNSSTPHQDLIRSDPVLEGSHWRWQHSCTCKVSSRQPYAVSFPAVAHSVDLFGANSALQSPKPGCCSLLWTEHCGAQQPLQPSAYTPRLKTKSPAACKALPSNNSTHSRQTTLHRLQGIYPDRSSVLLCWGKSNQSNTIFVTLLDALPSANP